MVDELMLLLVRNEKAWKRKEKEVGLLIFGFSL
jgi:hypothetical protein